MTDSLRSLRFALIGAGEIGRLRAMAIGALAGGELVAVVDPDLDRARRVAAGAEAGADFRPALGRPDVDAVVVSSPVHFHEEHVVAAIEAGKHVLCEKPLANTVAACQRMLSAAQVHERILATGFNHRYYPAVQFLKRAVDDGRIGRLDHLRIFGGHDGLHNFRADWMYKRPESGGGAMMDIGIHLTDLARYVAGEITEVYGVARDAIWKVEGSEDNAVAVFRSETGVPVHYQATWAEWRGYHWHVDAYGDRGMVRASYAPMYNLLVTQDGGGRRVRKRRFYPEIIVREKLKGWQTTTLGTFAEEVADFVRRIRGEAVPIADGWSGLRAVEIANAVYESSARGAAVKLSAR